MDKMEHMDTMDTMDKTSTADEASLSPPSKGLGLDNDIDAALKSPSTPHASEYRFRRHPSPSPRDMFAVSRPMTMSTKRLSASDIDQARKIKYGSGKHVGVELVPQPSDSPDDPLNWLRWRKLLNLASLLLAACLSNATKTMLIPVNAGLVARYRTSYAAVASLTAAPLILASFSGVGCSILARIWGKRPVYLAAMALLFMGCIWNSCADEKFADCMGARLFQGIAWGAFDTLLVGSIQDTYHEHEYPIPMTIYDALNFASTWGPPILGGVASRNAHSFTVQFRIIVAFICVSSMLLVLGAPETTYERYGGGTCDGLPVSTPSQPHEGAPILSIASLKEYASRLRFVDYHGEASVRAVSRPIRACASPTVGLIAMGTFLPYSGLWGLLITMAQLLSPPPFSLGSAGLGAMLTGPFLASAAAALGVSFWSYRTESRPAIQNSPQALLVATCSGSLLAFAGLWAYGAKVHSAMSEASSPRDAQDALGFPLLSFLLGILAGGCTLLLMATRPLVARSASASCASVCSRFRAECDMNTAVQFWRGIMAGILVAVAPRTMDAGMRAWNSTSPLRDLVVAMSVSHVAVVIGCTLLWRLYEQSIRQRDATIMAIEDMARIKRSGSFFDWD